MLQELMAPVVTLDLARSRFAYPSQVLFLGLNALGTVFGLAYNSKTPDLYPGSVHHTIGWALTGIAVSQFLVRISRSFLHYRSTRAIPTAEYHDEEPLVSPSTSGDGSDQHIDDDLDYRATSNPRRTPYMSGEEARTNRCGFHSIWQMLPRPRHAVFGGRYRKNVTWPRREFKFAQSLALDSFTDKISMIFSIVLVLLTFVNICVGLVTAAGIFVSLASPPLSLSLSLQAS